MAYPKSALGPKVRRSGYSTSLTLSHEANAAVREMLESPRKLGQFVSALILQERSRREERAQCQAELRAVYEGAGSGVDTLD